MILFIPQIVVLVKLHPNENVYFNFLVGGLSGAREKGIPFWGNSYGNAYWQAVKWINNNVEKGARLGLVQGTGINIPKIQLRDDIDFSNGYWSGMFKKGEYLMEMTFDSRINPYPYVWEYVDEILDPVYEVMADGVPIAKVWKNDLPHTKEKYKKPEVKIWNYNYAVLNKEINVIFDDETVLTRFFLQYQPDKKCSGVQARVETSFDGKNWQIEKDTIPVIQVFVDKLSVNTLPFFFAARDAKYLKIVTEDGNSCLLKSPSFEIWALK